MAWKKQWAIDIAKEQIADEQFILYKLEDYYSKAINDCEEVLQKLQDRMSKEGVTPSLLNQATYQVALGKQIQGIYNDIYGSVYNSVEDYLKQCYEDGILKSMYSLHQQGLDITIPINQNEIALMASKHVVNGFKLSTKLYADIHEMGKMVKDEMTRGLITNLSYADIARNLENRSKQALNRTMRIARTEGHRVTLQSQLQSMSKAKEKGADIVKQWDSTLDGKTRLTHRELDGQVREIDGKFKSSKGEAFYPGGFGIASEDINCRCAMLEIPRWALDDSDEVTKWDNESGKLLKSQKEVDLWKDSNNWTNGKGNKYNQFKKAYKKKAKEVSTGLTKEDQKKIKDYEDEISQYELEKEKYQIYIDTNFDLDEKYENIWKNPVTLDDYEDKKYKIADKLDYFINQKYSYPKGSNEYNKFDKLKKLIDKFDAYGYDYWQYKDKINSIQNKIDDLKKQIDFIKNPEIYKQMISGGSINQNCTWKNLFSDRYSADDYFRKWADKTTYSLGDASGQKALYKYTAGSGFMNRPLSGYKDGWSRHYFVGFDKVDLNYEGGKSAINGLTKLIDKTEPLKEGIVLRRGSDSDGLIGLFEGGGFDYSTIKKAVNSGDIKKFEGSIIKNRAFTSCGIADGAGFGGEIEYIIKCPSGTKMVYAEPQSHYGNTISRSELYKPGMRKFGVGSEAEMILQRGTSFRIDKITKSGYGYKLEMTVIDQDKF